MTESRLNRRHLVFGTAGAALLGPARFSQAAAAASPNQALTDLLAMIPTAAAPISSDSVQIATFCNFAAQLKTAGVAAPHDLNAPAADFKAWNQALAGLALPTFFDYVASPDWLSTFGFSMLQADQSLEAGSPPLVVTILKGQFSKSAIGAALTKSGYKTIADPKNAIWSLHEDETFDIDNPANKLALARLNNVALTADGVLIGAPRLDLLKSILALGQGGATLASNDEIAALIKAAPAELATAMLLTGDGLIGRATSIKLVLTGLNLGVVLSASGPGAGRNSVAEAKWELLLLESDEKAAQARAKTIDSQLSSGKSMLANLPYKSFFANWKINVAPSTSIVSVELTFVPGRSAALWVQMILNRDVAWLGAG